MGLVGGIPFLSILSPVTIFIEGDPISYPSIKNAYEASKTFDQGLRDELRLRSPEALWANRNIPYDKLRNNWSDRLMVHVMRKLMFQKFNGNDITLVRQLLATNNRLIGYYSWDDGFWEYNDTYSCNFLGILLMEVRTYVQAEKEVLFHHFHTNEASRKDIERFFKIDEKLAVNKLRAYDIW